MLREIIKCEQTIKSMRNLAELKKELFVFLHIFYRDI